MAARFAAGDETLDRRQVQERLQHWLVHHVWEEDLQFAAFIRPQRQLSARGSARQTRNSPLATATALPPTSTLVTPSAPPSARAYSVLGRPISSPCEM